MISSNTGSSNGKPSIIAANMPPYWLSDALRWAALIAVAWAAYSVLAVIKEQSIYSSYADIPSGLEAVLSLSIGLLLAFRSNAAYSRWWEARKLWGSLVNASRNLAIKVEEMATSSTESKQSFCDQIIQFCYALKIHLEFRGKLQQVPGLESEAAQPHHVPSWIAQRMYAQLEKWKKSDQLDDIGYWMIDREMRILLDICGGCERIKNTPIVLSYRAFTQQCLFLFLLSLPWGLVNVFGMWTIPVTGLSAFVVIAVESVARHIEDPFGTNDDQLDLAGVCNGIRISVTQISGRDPDAQ